MSASPLEKLMPFTPRKHIPLFIAALGVVFLALGIFFLIDDSPQRDAERVESLASIDTGSLRSRSIGEVLLVQGHLAASNRAVFREFVACVRDRYDGEETSGASKGREKWTRIETLAPPLEIEAARGTIEIANSGYELRSPPHVWRDLNPLGDLVSSRGERASGFVVGDEVTVEGRVTEARTLEAVMLFGGRRAAYLESLRSGIVVARILGGVFTGVGGVLALVGGGIAWRSVGRSTGTQHPKAQGRHKT